MDRGVAMQTTRPKWLPHKLTIDQYDLTILPETSDCLTTLRRVVT
jgi:hypothetical protein